LLNTSVRVVREAHTEVAIHGGGVEGTWVAVAEHLKSLVVLGAQGKNSSTMIDMSVDNDENVGVFGAGDLELS